MAYNLPILSRTVAGDRCDVGGCGDPGDVSQVFAWSRHGKPGCTWCRAQRDALHRRLALPHTHSRCVTGDELATS
ncbi:hypothetical protein K3U93_08025 [Mycobacterium malmoense]|uniref:Uncharacterized protein n=1 Tax=Mycobacterium malmoense TaxID=1780 RepID=A0ABX3SUD0_MYCMA|nr:hypothetical protein [Mycobacterium malmoense]OIN81228.1 hypothetical protein BMG05_09120 [Mycobacterium malmoense]ORA84112.1 hypothetical protein BST29_06285 [Mycobacterium malmoense]QZA19066.1 hypothetical protein K3U93_08025 [Mycobacterium malmoense]UNB95829.1 hypothetical protein H5T25_08015 [Mycobacterium malmoense]